MFDCVDAVSLFHLHLRLVPQSLLAPASRVPAAGGVAAGVAAFRFPLPELVPMSLSLIYSSTNTSSTLFVRQ